MCTSVGTSSDQHVCLGHGVVLIKRVDYPSCDQSNKPFCSMRWGLCTLLVCVCLQTFWHRAQTSAESISASSFLEVAVWKRSFNGKCIMPLLLPMATLSVAFFRRTLQIRTLPASDDLVEMEFPLYRKYQMLHHGEDPAEVCHASLILILSDDGSL